jgi:ARG and Rhodanese-Phosphatase-superfamily-associated Protein domain
MTSKYKRKEVTNMQEVIREYLEMAKVGRKQVYKNMAVYPLLSDYSLGLEYILLDEALGSGVIEVTEVNDHSAVPNLMVHNKSLKMVLILDGEELVGAKQNRIVNTTILIAVGAMVVIPVSCVEQGRWAYKTPQFYSEERIMPSRMRAMKSEQVQRPVRARGKYQAEQSAIWADISQRASRRDAMSASMAMTRIYEKDLPFLHEYLQHFSLVGYQVGAVFTINGEVVGMVSFLPASGRASSAPNFPR